MARFVLWGTYCDNVLEKRAAFREEHLAGLQRQKDEGVLITIGPTVDASHVFGIYEAETQDQVEALVKADVYWQNCIWTEVKVHPWVQVF
jgi:uncharacterized protein YciI